MTSKGVVRIVIYMHILSFSSAEIIRSPQNMSVRTLPDISSLCPYSQFCKSSPLKTIQSPDMESCCEKCSCESDCHETGSCCYDAPSADSTSLKYPCIHVSEVAKQIPGLYLDLNSVLRFHIITNCLDDSQKERYPKCYQPVDTEDFVIVSDQQGKVYRNKHCAECNDVHTYESWMLRILCLGVKNIFHIELYEEMEQYFQENCSFLSYPPNQNAGSMSHCNQNIISECNETGSWEIYDEELEEACNENRENQNAVFRKTDNTLFGDHNVFYSSVYCYFCNEPQSSVKKDQCKVIDLYSSSRSNGLIRIMGKLERQTEPSKEQLCKSFDIWDPFQKICRPLICPSGKKPFNGRCIGLLSNIVGLSFSLNFEITFVDRPKPQINLNLLSKIEKVVLSKLGNDLKCGKCVTRLFNHISYANSVFVQLDIFTTGSCSDDVLLRRIRKLAGKEKLHSRLRDNHNETGIELKLRFEELRTNESFIVMNTMKYSLCFPPKVIDSTIFQHCSRILISKQEASGLGFKMPSLVGNETDLDSLHVCLDTYFSKNRSKSGASTFVNGWRVGLIGRLLFMYIIYVNRINEI